MALDVSAYLHRISYTGPLDPTGETLTALHLAHLYTVPFENLDIGLGRPLSLALPALYDKIVTRRRGGFCYELNGLFGWLLQELGFGVTYLSARVANDDGSYGPEFDHLELEVADAAGQHWLADVGFGDSFMRPFAFQASAEQAQPYWTYGLSATGDDHRVWRRDPTGKVEPQTIFTRQPRQFPADFEPMCLYQQTAPESHFVNHRLCTLATPTGRISVENNWWIVTENGQRRVETIDDAEFWRLVHDAFHIPRPI